jgi:hypothetical protein
MITLKSITLYLFVVSIIYCLKFIFDLVINLNSEEPEQMKLSTTNKIFILLSTSYIITYILSSIIY